MTSSTLWFEWRHMGAAVGSVYAVGGWRLKRLTGAGGCLKQPSGSTRVCAYAPQVVGQVGRVQRRLQNSCVQLGCTLDKGSRCGSFLTLLSCWAMGWCALSGGTWMQQLVFWLSSCWRLTRVQA